MKTVYLPQSVKTVILTALNMLHGSNCKSWVGVMTQDQCQINPFSRSARTIMALCQGQKSTDAFLKSLWLPDLPTQLLEYSSTANNNGYWLDITWSVLPPLLHSISLFSKENWSLVKKRGLRIGMATHAFHFCTRKAYIKHVFLSK